MSSRIVFFARVATAVEASGAQMQKFKFWGSSVLQGIVTLLFVAIGFCGDCSAQVLLSPALQTDDDKVTVEDDTEKGQRITLQATKQADPLLRHRLWPAPEDRKNRLAAPIVSRAVILIMQTDKDAQREMVEKYEEWREIPLSDIPLAEAHKLLAKFQTTTSEVRRIENMMGLNYDLGIEEMTTNQRIRTWLPEFQEMRQLARVLALKIRVAIAEKRFDDAIGDLRVGIRLGEVAGHSTDFLIGRLVGIAIHGVMMEEVMVMMQQPGAPSLYWALAAIPTDRIFDMNRSLEFESAIIAHIGMISDLNRLPDDPIGEVAAAARLQTIANQVQDILQNGGFEPEDSNKATLKALMNGVYVASMIEPSRQVLSETEMWGDRMDELSDVEIVLRAADLNVRRSRDGWLMWSLIPQEDWKEYEGERRAALMQSSKGMDVGNVLARMLSPAVEAVNKAQRRALQTHHLVMTFEALRIHAAESGELPESLDALRPVPARRDSISGEHFKYIRTTARKAVLTRVARYPGDEESIFEIHLESNK